MAEQKNKGNEHVMSTKKALVQLLMNAEICGVSDSAIETAKSIINSFPGIQSVHSKFESSHPDLENDITLILRSGKEVPISMFTMEGSGDIQPSNPGAKSFILKYFNNSKLQNSFNDLLEEAYNQYLVDLYEYKTNLPASQVSKKQLKELSPFDKPEKWMKEIQKQLLFNIRESCFEVLQRLYNTEQVEHAVSALAKVDSHHVVTRIDKRGDLRVEIYNPKESLSFKDIRLLKSGKNGIYIICGNTRLNFRFKLEWRPLSSIKLAIGYKRLSKSLEDSIHAINYQTITQANKILFSLSYVWKKNQSNAIGKVNEALVYVELLRKFPETNQVDEKVCVKLIEDYGPFLTIEDRKMIQLASELTANKIHEFMNDRYPGLQLENIQLVPESYLADKLDTTDLELVIRDGKNRLYSQRLSLKAISRKQKVTLKNPGIGTILGEKYFNLSENENKYIISLVTELKEKYTQGGKNHTECLEIISQALFRSLQGATQIQLRQGTENIFGKPLVVTTVYKALKCYIHEREAVDGQIMVKSKSKTQTALIWKKGMRELTLRVKFSIRQSKGWSSIKLAAQQKINEEELMG